MAVDLRAVMNPPFDKEQFLPGDRAPSSKAYQEVDPRTRQPLRRLLVSRGEVFPAARCEGGFFTLVQDPRRIVTARGA